MSTVHVKISGSGLWYALVALVGVGIIYNAAFLQTSMHPDPLFQTRLGYTTVSPEPAVRAPIPRSQDVSRIQRRLQKLGYYQGAIDGLKGSETRAGIAAFGTDYDFEAASISDAMLVDILDQTIAGSRGAQFAQFVPAPRPAQPETTASVSVPQADPMVAAVQIALSDAAYGPLRTDGLMGRETTDAIRRFQLDNGLALTGAVDNELVQRLVAVGAMRQ